MNSTAYTTLINVNELENIQPSDDLVILDCRFALAEPDLGRQLYLQSHIPGAYFMDINLDLSSPVIRGVTGRHPLPNPEVLTSALRAAGLNPECQVVVYDQANGMYASRAWWLLNWLGHEKVALLNGGYAAWTAREMPVDNQWPAPKQGHFEFIGLKQKTLTHQEVAERTQMLIDSRDLKRFTGETEPIDAVAGHIPGAICLPFLDNVDEKGYWKSPETLRKKFEAIVEEKDEQPVFYCGSGVTACHNILAFKIATGREASLYGGSYSEWINYHPVATGE